MVRELEIYGDVLRRMRGMYETSLTYLCYSPYGRRVVPIKSRLGLDRQ
jgi:hypothetical protein